MSVNQRKQQEAMSTIDAAKAMVDKVFTIMGLMQGLSSNGITVSTNPIGMLMQMLKHLGVSYEEIRKWLTDFLIYVTPTLEVGVKAVILSNLKSMISCSSDPRIPYKFRKYHKAWESGDQYSNEYGIDINVESIDFFDKLSISPLSDEGREMYFGLEGVDDVYKFARADDFDAFLWFVIHKGKFPRPTIVDSISDISGSVSPSDGTLMSQLTVINSSNSPSKYILGNTFRYSNTWPSPLAMCIDVKYDDKNNIVENTIVPVSDDQFSAHWYMRRADQLGKNIGFGWGTTEDGTTKYNGKPRDFSKEMAICNLQYINNANGINGAPIGWANDRIRFTILPRVDDPYYNKNNQGIVTSMTVPLFDDKGKYDINGNYTFIERPLTPPSKEQGADEKNLKACYKGLTVYEFNYDYLMSIKLFDAKILATAIMDCMIDTQVGFNAKLAKRRREAQDMVRELVKSIIEKEDPTINDCFFTFDNKKYENLLRKSAERRAKAIEFGDAANTSTRSFVSVSEILAEYDANADMNVQENVISRAIQAASVNVSDGVDGSNKYAVELGFATDLVNNLVNGIVFAILSPKLLMLLEVNKQLMGDASDNISFEELLLSMSEIIVGIVKEIRDIVAAELFKLVMKQLDPIITMMGSAIIREAADDYTSLIRDIIANCAHLPSFSKNKLEETNIDNVDYADIVDVNTRTDVPKENC